MTHIPYVITVGQRSPKQGPWAKSGSVFVFANKGLFKHSQFMHLHCVCGCFSEGRSVITAETVWPRNFKLFIVWSTSLQYCNRLREGGKAITHKP